MIGRQLESMDNSGKTRKVNEQDVKIIYPVDNLIRCLLDDKVFGSSNKYSAHPKCIEGQDLSFNQNVLHDI